MVRSDHDAACRHLPSECGRYSSWDDRLRGSDWRSHLRAHSRVPARPWSFLWSPFRTGRNIPSRWICSYRFACGSDTTIQDQRATGDRDRGMKVTDVRTRVVQWEGETVPLPPHFCTNPMDLVAFRKASMGNFAFHNWLLIEIFTDKGLVGLGNAALSPTVTKQLIDVYLKPLLIGADPWDVELIWQQMYRRTLAFGRK